jgi:stage II sporulation protein D
MWFGNVLFLMSIGIVSLLSGMNDPQKETSQAIEKQEKRHYRVRVLLQEIEDNQNVTWNIQGDSFILIDPNEKTKTEIDAKELTITIKKNFFSINGTVYDKKKLYMYPKHGYLKFNTKQYEGSFLIVHDAKNFYLINSIDIEDYVCSVLRTESWPGWPLEVNKAFAIASRSYVLGIILANRSNRSNKLPYHVKNTNKHQTYSGLHADPILKEAVNQTRGIFLTYDNKPIIAMFDSCCGGIVPAHIHDVNFAHAPYLARKYACSFCKDCKVYSWNAQYSLDHFEQILKDEYKKLKKIKTIKTKTDKAGLVQHVTIKAQPKLVSIPGKKLYSMLSKVRSFCFEVTLNANKVIFQGRGIGHHLGLCQWGAREMVRQGYTHKSILSFYYPDTSFMRLQ